jgi:hypothetical protein
MPTVPRHAPRARRLTFLLAALTALLLAGFAGATTPLALHGLGAQDRVGAFTPAAQLLARPTASQSSCSRTGFLRWMNAVTTTAGSELKSTTTGIHRTFSVTYRR